MAVKKSGYDELFDEFRTDPINFVFTMFGIMPTDQQKQVLEAVAVPGAKISVRSGHGVGKTSCMSWLIAWFLFCHKDCKIPVTAPSGHQLFDNLWGELFKWREKMPEEFKNQYFVSSDRAYMINEPLSRYAAARTARRENPEALQGFHADNLLFCLDEASGIEENIFEVAEGALSTKNSRVIMFSNPTRIEGYFHRSQTTNRKNWKCFHFSSIDSPLVDPQYVQRMKESYGEDSNIYKVRVLGEFPDSSSETLISLPVVESAMDRDVSYPSASRIAGLDVARFGDDKTALIVRQGGIIDYIDEWQGADLMNTCGKIISLYREKHLFDRIHVDAIGLGSGIVDRLSELRIPVLGINVAESASYSDKFNRLRDELWWKCRDFFNEKQCKIDTKKTKYYTELLGELTAVRYGYTSSGKIKIEAKDEMKKRGVASPNIADALCLTFAEGPIHERYMSGRRQIITPSSSGWI